MLADVRLLCRHRFHSIYEQIGLTDIHPFQILPIVFHLNILFIGGSLTILEQYVVEAAVR